MVESYLADHAGHKGIKAARTQYGAWRDIVGDAQWRNPEDARRSTRKRQPAFSISRATIIGWSLRNKNERSDALRSALAKALSDRDVKTAFDIFGSELPDEAFTGVFDRRVKRIGARSICEIPTRHEHHF